MPLRWLVLVCMLEWALVPVSVLCLLIMFVWRLHLSQVRPLGWQVLPLRVPMSPLRNAVLV